LSAAALLCLVLCIGTAAGLPAQELTVTGGDNVTIAAAGRPQRSILPDSELPARNLTFSRSSMLLTPEVLNQPLTRHYIARYSSPSGISWLNSIIRNGSLYLPFVKEEIAKRGLPPELAFLPFIESGYLGTARSKSGAVGLWQFMMNSIAPFDIRVNDMIDERRDFRKATVAALQKLSDNYRVLGNWPLALAAYNAGLGGVSRAVKRANSSDYWTLCDKKEFKTETIHYVPKFAAVSHILSSPRQFGLDYWPDTEEWTTVKPGTQVSLDIIALEAGADRTLLHRLNLELLLGITPADKHYELKIPLAHAETIAGLLEKEDTRLLRYYHYRIQYGDTLSALSRHYGVPLNMIEQYNPGILKRYLQIGEIILIPAFKDTSPYEGGPYEGAPYKGGSYTGETSTATSNQSAGTFRGSHVVSKGDTLWSVAIRYQVDPQELAQENNMDLNEILSIGKVLKVPIIEKESWEE
jgi:membrane-bound lytic murein transglycosylase D